MVYSRLSVLFIIFWSVLLCSFTQSLDDIERLSFNIKESLVDKPVDAVLKQKKVCKFGVKTPKGKTKSLDGAWLMASEGTNDQRLYLSWNDAISVNVPGSVHKGLWENNLIPNPYIARNDSIAELESYKTWWFKKSFAKPKTVSENLILSFKGVANKCTVWLNGVELGSHEGMFGGPDFLLHISDLKDINELVVKLDPIPNIPEDHWPLTANKSWKETVVFNCVYGWHYVKIPSLGIWQSVILKEQPIVDIQNPYIATKTIDGRMFFSVNLNRKSVPINGVLSLLVTPKNFSGKSQVFEYKVNSNKNNIELNLEFLINNPRLWWPNDMGDQDLYTLKVLFKPHRGTASFEELTFGIRTVDMQSLPEGPNKDLYNWTFVINNKPMFVKGSGWCTMDPLMDFSREKYKRQLLPAKMQHIQMLRAWGGGMPETDEFYDLCDEYGIMVIQEWPTAWNSHNTQPYEMLKETVIRNTFRLRNRPSLVMWCAGNESDKPFGKAIDMMGRLSYELDGSRPFHRAEAWGGSDHNYECWWEDAHLDHNLNMTSKFWGEFGIPSLPNIETTEFYLAEESQIWPPLQNGYLSHHTPIFGTHNELGKLEQYSSYFMPYSSLDDVVVGSQLAQTVGVRHTLERARTRWPNCTGALYYKLNDNYPALSWATIDFFGSVKSSHYFIQKSFSPIASVILFDKTNYFNQEAELPVFLLDDNQFLKDKSYRVSVSVFDNKFNKIKQQDFSGVGTDTTNELLGEIQLNKEQTSSNVLFFLVDIIENEVLLYRNYYFTNYEMSQGILMEMPKTELEVRRKDKNVTITNTGSFPAVGVHVLCPGFENELICSENYIWLNRGESKTININLPEPVEVKAWNVK